MFSEFEHNAFKNYINRNSIQTNLNCLPNISIPNLPVPDIDDENKNQIVLISSTNMICLETCNICTVEMLPSFLPQYGNYYRILNIKITDEYSQYLNDRDAYSKLDIYENKKILSFRDVKLNVSSYAAWINIKLFPNQINYCLKNLGIGMASFKFGLQEFKMKPMKTTIRNAIVRGYRQAACVSAFEQKRLPCEKDLKGLDFPDGYYSFNCDDISSVLTTIS